MEDHLLPEAPTYKLYKERAVIIATFIGGPLVAGYLIAENFRQMGQKENAKKTWIFTVIATIVIFGSGFFIPNVEKVPNYLFPLIYTILTAQLVKHLQGALIQSHVEHGGQLFSVWRAVLAGLIGLVALIAVILIIAFFIGTETP